MVWYTLEGKLWRRPSGVQNRGVTRRLAGLLALSLAILPAEAVAQVVRGEIVTRDSVAVSGAIVTLVDSIGGESARVLSGSTGAYELRAPRTGTYRLRVEAVGYSAVISLPMTLSANERRTQRIHMVDATRVLSAVQVRARSRCDLRPEEGTQVALLWTEAKKTLSAVVLSAGETPFLAFDQDLVDYDSAVRRIAVATRTTVTARANDGYGAPPIDELRAHGYIRRLGNLWDFAAPDAGVLLSEDFAATHCFSIVDRDHTSADRVGLRFAPVDPPRGGRAGIRGTLWLERQGYALDRVEFLYTPRQSDEHSDTLFGGWVRFRRLASGRVIVRQWEMRTPTFQPKDGTRESLRGMRTAAPTQVPVVVKGMRVARGMAREFSEEAPPLPTVTALLRRTAEPPSCFGLTRDPARVELPGAVATPGGRPVSGARVRATWAHALADSGRIAEQWAESGADANGRFMLCGLPPGIELRLRAVAERDTSTEVRVTLARGTVSPVRLTFARDR
jgi:hypothetical protein